MTTITMPQFGESVTEGTVLKWLKQPGDHVALDEPLCEIETEKVTAELPSPVEGTLGTLLVEEGETVDVGAPLCEIAEASGNGSGGAEGGSWRGGPMAILEDERPAAAAAGTTTAAPPRTEHASRSPDERGPFYSPVVLRLAREHGIDVDAVQGSGVGGRVTRKDIEACIASKTRPSATPERAEEEATPAPAAELTSGYEVIAQSPTRRTIAEHLKRSNLEAPQAWTMVEADVTALVQWREREKERMSHNGVELTLLAPFTAAVCATLRDHPLLNARWEGDELRRYAAMNVGIAVATDHGLVVPVIRDAGDLNVSGLAKRIADVSRRARARELRVEDVQGGTFTVNNTGSFGSVASKPIVNHPEVAIVTMERAVKRPVVVDGDAIAVRWMMNVCLSFDHRALDGAEVGAFLADLKGRLERAEVS